MHACHSNWIPRGPFESVCLFEEQISARARGKVIITTITILLLLLPSHPGHGCNGWGLTNQPTDQATLPSYSNNQFGVCLKLGAAPKCFTEQSANEWMNAKFDWINNSVWRRKRRHKKLALAWWLLLGGLENKNNFKFSFDDDDDTTLSSVMNGNFVICPQTVTKLRQLNPSAVWHTKINFQFHHHHHQQQSTRGPRPWPAKREEWPNYQTILALNSCV